MDKHFISSIIDHTNLKPGALRSDIHRLCGEAVQYSFKTVCINPVHVKFAVKELKGTGVGVCTVIGFPLGAATTGTKEYEAKEAVNNGAGEIDMVMNIGALKAGESHYVLNEIRQVVESTAPAMVKVIIEACLLSDEEKENACKLIVGAGAHFVKTSTGFSLGGATIADVMLMKKAVGEKAGVKAAGGIRDHDTLISLVQAGANRIGTSAGVQIISSWGQKD
ncbi:MAG: deoxyribose-phosphate aldolase [Desulfitobacteriaceae bacterium]|nr:deoxyribose-phosphate aldolase [Desulfitobacteriaceae bacterium]